MRFSFHLLLVVCLIIIPHAVFAEPVISPEPALPSLTRGQEVVVHGKEFPPPDEKGGYQVILNSGKPEERIMLPAKRVDANAFSFTLPNTNDQLPAGRYLVSVRMAGKEYQVPGDLRVLPDSLAPVHLDAIYPLTAYPSGKPGNDFDISGQNLAAVPQDNRLIVVDRGPVSVGDAKECDEMKRTGHFTKTCLFVEPGMETRKVHVVNFPHGRYDGPIHIQLQVGSNLSNALPLTFSRVSQAAALTTALLVFVVIMAIVVLLVSRGIGRHTIGTRQFSPWTAFFLDKETNTYSLSKFQLLLWTSVFVFSYLYLFLCRALIQWKLGLPPVPQNLPTMLAISAGATVISAGVTETRGSKGSGPVYPSAADFVSTGGLVVGERFQFFVWTLVGTFQFLTMMLMTDPATLSELPDIPANFLYLMGISSAGYLAGKVIRKPGPVIRNLTVVAVTQASASNPATMTMLLKGENLSENGTIIVDEKMLEQTSYAITGKKPHPQAPDPSFNNEIEIVLKDAEAYLGGSHTLTLTNRDGQVAAIGFPNNAPVIESVSDLAHGESPVELTVKGKNFSGVITGTWKDPGENSLAIGADQVKRKSQTELAVSIVPGPAGTGSLTLVSQVGLAASKQVTVS